MKTIAVILPLNNPDILKQADLDSYQSDDYYFKVYYIDTLLKEINTAEEAATLLPLVVKKAEQAAKEGASAIIVFAFGDLGVLESRSILNIPVMALGNAGIHKASRLTQKKFTVLPGMLAHNEFIHAMITEEKLMSNYNLAKHSPELSLAQIRKNPETLQKLIETASLEILKNDIDTFTLGCGSFIGISKPLENALQEKFGTSIKVVDSIDTTFELAKTLAS